MLDVVDVDVGGMVVDVVDVLDVDVDVGGVVVDVVDVLDWSTLTSVGWWST